MSDDTKWLIGTGVVLAGLLSAQILSVNSGLSNRIDDLSDRIDDVNTSLSNRIGDLNSSLNDRMDRIENRLNGVAERLRNVEINLGKVDQRLLTIERVVLPAGDQPPE